MINGFIAGLGLKQLEISHAGLQDVVKRRSARVEMRQAAVHGASMWRCYRCVVLVLLRSEILAQETSKESVQG